MMARLASRGLRQTRGRGSRRGLFPGFGGAGARGFLPAAADFDGVLRHVRAAHTRALMWVGGRHGRSWRACRCVCGTFPCGFGAQRMMLRGANGAVRSV